MKHLLLIRHAKSSWDDPSLADFDRPLNARGLRDAPFMGSLLKFRGLVPDQIISSPARRARDTAHILARATGFNPADIDLRAEVYQARLPDLVALVRTLDDAWRRVYLIGHNPELMDLVDWLTGEAIDHLPTTGIASIEFPTESWAHIMESAGRLVWLDMPKRHL